MIEADLVFNVSKETHLLSTNSAQHTTLLAYLGNLISSAASRFTFLSQPQSHKDTSILKKQKWDSVSYFACVLDTKVSITCEMPNLILSFDSHKESVL